MIKQPIVRAGALLFAGLLFGCVTAEEQAPVEVASEPFKMPVRTKATRARSIWADSHLYEAAPALDFKEWLTDKPDTEGKFIIIEFWRTWCSACKKGTPFLNEIQKRYPDDVVVIGVNAQSAEKIAAYDGPKKNYYLAVDKPQPEQTTTPETVIKDDCEDGVCTVAPDTKKGAGEQGALEAYFGVWGWPHVLILEPTEHVIIWEGFPSQPGYELTEEIIQKCISIQSEQ